MKGTKLMTDVLKSIRVFNGKVIPYFNRKGKPSTLSPSAHNEVVAGLNSLTNAEIRFGPTNAVFIGDKKTVYQIANGPDTTAAVGAYPFQLYPVPEDQIAPADKAKTCYAIRAGIIELRSKWFNFTSSAGYTNVSNQGDGSFYHDNDGGEIGDGVEITDSPIGPLASGGTYFALNDISGVDQETADGGVHTYGCYYAFWLEIADFTANVPTACTLKCRRFSFESGPVYSPVAFPAPKFMWEKGVGCPSPVNEDDYELAVEVIPIAILQLKVGNQLGGGGYGVIKGNEGASVIAQPVFPAVMQIQRDHLVNRFSLNSFRAVGEYNPTQYRTYYPGDVVSYYVGGDNTSPLYGKWLCFAPYTNGAAETDPPGAAFFYLANINQPSVTNPP